MKKITIKHGVIAGMTMSVLLFGLAIIGDYGGSPLKYLKYLILFATIAYSLKLMKDRHNADHHFFSKALIRGLNLSLISAGIISILNIVMFSINPEYSIAKWNLEPSTVMEAMVVSVSILLEMFVMGGIATFVTFQALKPAPYVD